MDAVYICRPGDQNEELRISLRSLYEHLPFIERVWMVGAWPAWVRNVDKLPVPARRNKHDTAEANLVAACQEPGISDPFLIMNDDFYVLQTMPSMPTLHMGNLDRQIAEHQYGSAYRRAMQLTADRLRANRPDGELFCYELHAPMVIEKTGMLLALSIGQGIHGVHNRTLYGNLMEVGGQEVEDCKVYRSDKPKPYASMPFLSTSDRTFHYHPAGRWLRDRFQVACPYEAADRPGIRRSALVRHSTFVSHPQ